MVNNKKGWLRIIESTIAVLIILSAFMILYESQKAEIRIDPGSQISQALDFAATNESLRNDILNNSASIEIKLTNLLDENLNKDKINYTLVLCSAYENCNADNSKIAKNKDIYTIERIVSTNLTLTDLDYAKKIKIFYWEIN